MMDGRGGCCIASYAAGGNSGHYEMSKIDRIMLKYRPIAPKPAGGSGMVSGEKVTEKPHSKTGRGRKKSGGGSNGNNSSSNNNNKVKCNSGGGGRKRKSTSSVTVDVENIKSLGKEVTSNNHTTVVTLPLLPETPDLTVKTKNQIGGSVWLSFNGNIGGTSCYRYGLDTDDGHERLRWFSCGGDHQMGVPSVEIENASRHKEVVGSWVIVDCVTETWGKDNVNGTDDDQTRVLGRTDEEKMRCLDDDSCPGFISDGWNKVWWTNKAYKEMVSSSTRGEVMVWVVMRESLPVGCRGFSCRVRCHHRSGKDLTAAVGGGGSSSTSSTVPCDAWRMDTGGFAWRLDVKAALSLGR